MYLEFHQFKKAFVIHAVVNVLKGEIEVLQVVNGEVNPAAQQVFANIPQDVGQLQRYPQFYCIRGSLVKIYLRGEPNYGNGQQSDRGSNFVTVIHKLIPGLIMLFFNIHLDAVD